MSAPTDELVDDLRSNPTPTAAYERYDIGRVTRYCESVEMCDLLDRSLMSRNAYDALLMAKQRGVRFSNGWVFSIDRILAVAADALDEVDTSENHFREALETTEGASARPEHGRTMIQYADFLMRRRLDQTGAANDLSVRAAELFERLGITAYRDHVDALRQRLA